MVESQILIFVGVIMEYNAKYIHGDSTSLLKGHFTCSFQGPSLHENLIIQEER